MLRSHLWLRIGVSLILEANLPLVPVANKLQAELAAALATAKASVLVCAVIRSLIKQLRIFPLPLFLNKDRVRLPFGQTVLGGAE